MVVFPFVGSRPALAPLAYLAALTFLPLIGVPRLVLALMGGALFGMYYGTLYAVAGSTLASTAVGFYFVIRRSKRREVIDTAQKNVNQ